jgi:hypothetical protein
MRQYIRHPASIPIFYDLVDRASNRKDYLKNISHGGLCFQSKQAIETGACLLLQIPFTRPVFKEQGLVVWCQATDGHYEVGVQFTTVQTEFRVRMVEQVCYIEEYRHDLFAKEGREVSSEAAATEWIMQYGRDFPRA